MDAARPAAMPTRIDALLAEHVAAGHWPGAAWAVGRPGDERPLAGGAVGLLAREPGAEPVRADTLYDLASLTKPLALGAIVLALAAEGRLDPEEPLDAELPELAERPAGAPSLVDLLVHRAGLPAWYPLYRRTASLERVPEVIAELAEERPVGGPVYSCLGPIAAGIALERRFGVPLRELFAREVAAPLGLDGREVTPGPVDPALLAVTAPTECGRIHEAELAAAAVPDAALGTALVPGPPDALRGEVHDGNAAMLGGFAGNAGLFATAGAVFRIASAIASGERPFDRLAARLVASVLAEGGCDARTFAFQSGRAPQAPAGPFGPRSFGHTGFAGTSVWISPEHDLVAVLLTNRVHPRWTEAPIQRWRRSFHEAVLRFDGDRA